MKRSGFKPRVYEREKSSPKPVPVHLRRSAVIARADVMAAPITKDEPLRSEAYRRLVASLPCIHCHKVGRSQHAHENEAKAKGMKLDDRRAMPLCADEPGAVGCHTLFDQYRLFPGGRQAHVEKGREWAARTRAWIIEHGLWPTLLPRWSE